MVDLILNAYIGGLALSLIAVLISIANGRG